MTLKPILLLAGLAAFGLGAAAHADTTTTYTLSTAQWNNDASCPKCGPTYGTITVDYSSATQATVTVDLTDSGRNIFFNQGGPAEDGDAIEFDLPSDGDFTITPTTTGFEADIPPESTLYGDFTDGVTCDYGTKNNNPGACQNSDETELSSLVFTISSGNGTPIDFTPNSEGIFFSTAVTDNADVDPTGDAAVTPEPGSLALLGTGMLGAAGALRRRLKM